MISTPLGWEGGVQEPVASVIMATLQEGNWVSAIESIATQAEIASEVIVVADRPEADPAVLDALAARFGHLRVLRNERNLGLTRSLNRAAAVARGRYLVRHDDDDLARPDRLARLVAFLDANPGIDIVSSFAAGRMMVGDVETRWTIRSPLTDQAIKRRLGTQNCLVHPTVAFRAEQFRAIGGYDERFRYAQDYDIFLRAKRADLNFACLPDELVERVYSPGSITVKRRYAQATYSFAAKLLHKADAADRRELARDALYYLALIVTPAWARHLRRRIGLGR